MKCNQSRPRFELVSPCPFPTTITTTPRAPPYNNNKVQIDYVFLNKKLNNSALNCLAYSSDHQIVTAKIWLSLRRNMVQKTTTVHYDWSLLNNRDIRDKYALTLRNKFDALHLKRYILWMTNMRISSMPTEKLWETLAIKKKRADLKTASNCNRKHPTNTNALKLTKAQN